MGKVFFVIGVSGSGKSTIGSMLAKSLSMPFFDGDSFHSEANIMKMANGLPLTDEDRWLWLRELNLKAKEESEIGCVVACSALKELYRKILGESLHEDVIWVYLKGNYEQILARMQNRQNHFMKPEMLESQFQILN